MYCGGFPCQSFSIAGNRGGFKDTRGTLFFEFMRLARERQPKYLFLENVRGLLSHDGGKTFGTILNTLGELGYEWEYQILNSKDFGVPQNRERVFIIGHLGGTSGRKIFPIRRKNKATLKEHTQGMSQGYRVYDTGGIACTQAGEAGGLGAKTGLYKVGNIYPSGGQNGNVYDSKGLSPSLRSGQGVKGNGIGSCNSPKIKIKACLTPGRVDKRQEGRRFKNDGEPMFTLTGQDIHGVVINKGKAKIKGKRTCVDAHYYKELDNHQARTGVLKNNRIRKLTPKECWRLQGFPDSAFEKAQEVNSDTQLYRQAGNSVTVNVIEEIGKRL